MKPRPQFQFLLYVAGDTQNSLRAVANLTAMCRKYLPGQHEIEVVAVFKEPERALGDRVFMTPTLIRRAPLPACRIVGTLSHPDILLQALGLESVVA